MRVSSFGILGLGIILAAPATAQTLTAGKWTGTLNLSSGATIDVEFTVQGEGDAMQIVMKSVSGPPQPVTDLELSDKEMSFTWGAFTCSLERKNDSRFEGDCGGAAAAELTLDAPKERSSLSENVLTGEQLVATQQATVFDAVQQLRRGWLRGRGGARGLGNVNVAVLLGSQLMSGVDFLRTLEPSAIREVRYYTALEATTLLGRSTGGGAIVVTLR